MAPWTAVYVTGDSNISWQFVFWWNLLCQGSPPHKEVAELRSNILMDSCAFSFIAYYAAGLLQSNLNYDVTLSTFSELYSFQYQDCLTTTTTTTTTSTTTTTTTTNSTEYETRRFNAALVSVIISILSRINWIPRIDTYFFEIHSNIVPSHAFLKVSTFY